MSAASSSPFDDIHLGWAGQKYTIQSHRVMGAIKLVEDHLTLGELHATAARGKVKLSHVAAAYAELLRYAGAFDVTETDVYVGMFDGASAQSNVIGAVSGLLAMMIPRNIKLAVAPKGEGNRRVRRTAQSSSKRRSN